VLARLAILQAALDSGFAPSARPGKTWQLYNFFTVSLVVAASPHTGASAPLPQFRGR
jgi:hypothetical protein